MQIISDNHSTTRPVKILKGLNGSMYNTDISEYETEEGTAYSFTTYLFDNQEYDMLSVGILPPGAEWDDKLREIERSFLYDEADKFIAKYTTDVQSDEMRDKWIAYKAAVRSTPTQSGYPSQVTYPSRP